MIASGSGPPRGPCPFVDRGRLVGGQLEIEDRHVLRGATRLGGLSGSPSIPRADLNATSQRRSRRVFWLCLR
jgi:hypothetical protein